RGDGGGLLAADTQPRPRRGTGGDRAQRRRTPPHRCRRRRLTTTGRNSAPAVRFRRRQPVAGCARLGGRVRVPGHPPAARGDSAARSEARYSWTRRTTVAPSPTAEATRLIEP